MSSRQELKDKLHQRIYEARIRGNEKNKSKVHFNSLHTDDEKRAYIEDCKQDLNNSNEENMDIAKNYKYGNHINYVRKTDICYSTRKTRRIMKKKLASMEKELT